MMHNHTTAISVHTELTEVTQIFFALTKHRSDLFKAEFFKIRIESLSYVALNLIHIRFVAISAHALSRHQPADLCYLSRYATWLLRVIAM